MGHHPSLTPTDQPQDRASALNMAAYASGNLGKAVLIGGLELTAIYYLTDLIGAPPVLVGAAMFATHLWNAATDVVVGLALDRLNLSPRRAGPFLLAGAALAVTAFSLFYALPLLNLRIFALAIVLGLVARLAVSLIEVPHSALLISVAPDSRMRSRIAAYRFGFSTIGVLVLSSIVGLVINRSDTGQAERDIVLFGSVCAVMGVGTVVASWWSVRRFDRPSPRMPTPKTQGMPRLAQLRRFWHRDYVIVFMVVALAPLSSQLFMKSLAYEALYVLKDPGLVQTLLIAMMLGQIVGVPFWSCAARFEKAHVVSLAFVIMTVGFGAFHLLATRDLVWGVAAIAVVGVGASGGLSIIWSMAADCCDLTLARAGERLDGAAFGTLSFAGKLGSGLGALALGAGLSWTDYHPGASLGPTALSLMHGFNSLVPATVALICAGLTAAYRLTHARHAALVAILD